MVQKLIDEEVREFPERVIEEINSIINDVRDNLKMKFASVLLTGASDIFVKAITMKSDVVKIKRDYSMLERDVVSDKSVLISNAGNDPKYSDNPFVKHLGYRFLMSVPIMIREGKYAGSLVVIDDKIREISSYEHIIMEISANRIAKIMDENIGVNKTKKIKEIMIYPVEDVKYISTFTKEEIGFGEHRTCGLKQLYNHPEIQSVIPFHEGTTFQILKTITGHIKKGLVIEENISYSGIVGDCKVQFKNIKNGDEELFRIIFPDSKGMFPSDENCDIDFKRQYFI